MAILVAVLSTNNTTLRSCDLPNPPQATQRVAGLLVDGCPVPRVTLHSTRATYF